MLVGPSNAFDLAKGNNDMTHYLEARQRAFVENRRNIYFVVKIIVMFPPYRYCEKCNSVVSRVEGIDNKLCIKNFTVSQAEGIDNELCIKNSTCVS